MGIQEWIMGIAVKKGIVSLVKLIVSWLCAGATIKVLESSGVKVDEAQLTLALTAGINTGLTFVRNWLKVKFGVKFLG